MARILNSENALNAHSARIIRPAMHRGALAARLQLYAAHTWGRGGQFWAALLPIPTPFAGTSTASRDGLRRRRSICCTGRQNPLTDSTHMKTDSGDSRSTAATTTLKNTFPKGREVTRTSHGKSSSNPRLRPFVALPLGGRSAQLSRRVSVRGYIIWNRNSVESL